MAICTALLFNAVAGQANHNPPPLPDPIPGSIPTGPFTVELADIIANLVFPTDAEVPLDGSGRIFVTLRNGYIVIIDNGSVLPSPFLDISATSVSNLTGTLSSVAFHPDFAVPGSAGEGKLYTVSQEAPGSGSAHFGNPSNVVFQSVIYEWRASMSDPDHADVSTRREILRIDEQSSAHNIDDLAFGPNGYLYISKGDDDITANQVLDGTTIHGAILRIDIDDVSGNGRYSIPSDNPFVSGADPRIDEIYAYGFRNPWRISFDRVTGKLYVADVGEDDIEEMNIVRSGGYYGWIDKEGSFAFLDFNGVTDDLSDLPPNFDGIDPDAEYDHTEGDRSITGGFVYRGNAIPELTGHYVFADFISGRLMHIDPVSSAIREIGIDPAGNNLGPGIISFGESESGELLLVVTEQNLNPTGRIISLVNAVTEDVDSDGDGLLNSVDLDDDNDGLTDVAEAAIGANPLLYDTDNDGFGDGMEDAAGYDPLLDTVYPVWGDINDDRIVNVSDVMIASRSALGVIVLKTGQLARCNVAPLVGGLPQSLFYDECNTADLLLIQRKALGLTSF